MLRLPINKIETFKQWSNDLNNFEKSLNKIVIKKTLFWRYKKMCFFLRFEAWGRLQTTVTFTRVETMSTWRLYESSGVHLTQVTGSVFKSPWSMGVGKGESPKHERNHKTLFLKEYGEVHRIPVNFLEPGWCGDPQTECSRGKNSLPSS